MKTEDYPFDYPYRTRFTNLKKVYQFDQEDGVLYFAEQDGKYFTIFDQSFLMEFVKVALDEKLRNKLISIMEFDTEEERRIHFEDFVNKANQAYQD